MKEETEGPCPRCNTTRKSLWARLSHSHACWLSLGNPEKQDETLTQLRHSDVSFCAVISVPPYAPCGCCPATMRTKSLTPRQMIVLSTPLGRGEQEGQQVRREGGPGRLVLGLACAATLTASGKETGWVDSLRTLLHSFLGSSWPRETASFGFKAM